MIVGMLSSSHLVIKIIVSRIDVPTFKKIRSFADAWMKSAEHIMQRAGILTLLFLTQGRHQVVKGDLPRFFDIAISTLPTTLDDLQDTQKSLNEKQSLLGDEGITAGDQYSFYRILFVNETSAVDWMIVCELLQSCMMDFAEPFNSVLQNHPVLIDKLSFLLLSHHIYVRTKAAQLLRTIVPNSVQCWGCQQGRIFFVLQRIFIAFAMTSTDQCVQEIGNLLTVVIKTVLEMGGTYPPPEQVNNRELLKVTEIQESVEKEGNVRQYYDLEGLEDSEDSADLMEDSEEQKSNSESSEEASEAEEHSSSSASSEEKMEEEEESEEKVETKKKQQKRLLRRIPNPFSLKDTLFLLGKLIVQYNNIVRETALSTIEEVIRSMSAEVLLEHIVNIMIFYN